MMNRNTVETVMGAAVLVIAAVFLTFAYSAAGVGTGGGYQVTAKFDHIEGTREGGDVRISGIKVGTIVSQKLDPGSFRAILKLNIQDQVKLPIDTVATITSAGLLGDKFLQLVPGAEDATIPPGGDIKFTQAPVSLEDMLGKFIFSMQGNGGSGSSPAPAPSAGPAPTSPTPSHADGKS